MSLPRLDHWTHIGDQLNELAARLKTRSRLGFTDGNQVLETIAARFFNVLFGWDLINLNVLQVNYPAADLGDSKRRLAIQITTTKDSRKIKKTVDLFVKYSLGTDFDQFIIFFLLEKKPAIPKNLNQLPNGRKIENWDIGDLLNEIRLQELNTLVSASQLLAEEMGARLGQNLPGDAPKPSVLIRALAPGSNTPLNVLMRWAFFQHSAVVLLNTDYPTEVIHASLVRANEVGQMAAIRVQKTVPVRVWIRQDWLTVSSSGIKPSEIIQTLTQSGASGSNEYTLLKDQGIRLGLVIDGLPDLSPGTMAQFQTWLTIVRNCFPAWEPLIVLKHAMLEDAAANAACALSGIVECLNTVPDFESDPAQIVPSRPVGNFSSNGIGALLSLAWSKVQPSDQERTAAIKLLPWRGGVLGMTPVPLHAGGIVEQLEAMDIVQATELTKALCAWLTSYRTRLAAPIFQALGGSAPALVVVAARAAIIQPPLLDVLIAGVPEARRSEVLSELGAQCPRASGVVAAAWLRGVIRGLLVDGEACRKWIHSHCPSLALVAEAVLPSARPAALLALLQNNAPAGHFHWLAEIAPLLDFPLHEVDIAARKRPEFWALVQSLPVDPGHLHGVLSLPINELLILGCHCTGTEDSTPRPATKAHAAQLRQDSLFLNDPLSFL